MRKIRVLVITNDKYMGIAFCDIIELEAHHAILATCDEEWNIAMEVYQPDLVMCYENQFTLNHGMLDYFCGRLPIIITAWGRLEKTILDCYADYDIHYISAPCDAEDLMTAFHQATDGLQSDLAWLDV